MCILNWILSCKSYSILPDNGVSLCWASLSSFAIPDRARLLSSGNRSGRSISCLNSWQSWQPLVQLLFLACNVKASCLAALSLSFACLIYICTCWKCVRAWNAGCNHKRMGMFFYQIANTLILGCVALSRFAAPQEDAQMSLPRVEPTASTCWRQSHILAEAPFWCISDLCSLRVCNSPLLWARLSRNPWYASIIVMQCLSGSAFVFWIRNFLAQLHRASASCAKVELPHDSLLQEVLGRAAGDMLRKRGVAWSAPPGGLVPSWPFLWFQAFQYCFWLLIAAHSGPFAL